MMFLERNREQPGRLGDISFSSAGNLIDAVQMKEPADFVGIRPVKSEELDSRRDHLIAMAVQHRMDQHIAGCCGYPAGVSGLLEAAGQHNRRVGMQVAMPRQAEALRHNFYARAYVTKMRNLNCWPHVIG